MVIHTENTQGEKKMYEIDARTITAGIVNAKPEDWIEGYADMSLIDWSKIVVKA